MWESYSLHDYKLGNDSFVTLQVKTWEIFWVIPEHSCKKLQFLNIVIYSKEFLFSLLSFLPLLFFYLLLSSLHIFFVLFSSSYSLFFLIFSSFLLRSSFFLILPTLLFLSLFISSLLISFFLSCLLYSLFFLSSTKTDGCKNPSLRTTQFYFCKFSIKTILYK